MNFKFLFVILFVVGGFVIGNNDKMVCKNGVCYIKKNTDVESSVDEKSIVSSDKDQIKDRIIEITNENFDNLVKKSNKPVIIDFYATWCGPCKQVKPIFSEIAEEKTEWVFVSCDVDSVPIIASQYSVQAMPTFVVIKNGTKWGSVKGLHPKEKLIMEFEKIINSGAPINNKSEQIEQLFTAIFSNKIEIIKDLIAKGVDVNHYWENPQGNYYPLQYAIFGGTEEIIDILINGGANLDSIIKIAIEKQFEMLESAKKKIVEVFDYAQEQIKKAKTNSKKQESKKNEKEIEDLRIKFIQSISDISLLKQIIASGADVNTIFPFGNISIAPLYLAILFGNKEAVSLLINSGATLKVEVCDMQSNKKTLAELIKADIEKYDEIQNKAKKQL